MISQILSFLSWQCMLTTQLSSLFLQTPLIPLVLILPANVVRIWRGFWAGEMTGWLHLIQKVLIYSRLLDPGRMSFFLFWIGIMQLSWSTMTLLTVKILVICRRHSFCPKVMFSNYENVYSKRFRAVSRILTNVTARIMVYNMSIIGIAWELPLAINA